MKKLLLLIWALVALQVFAQNEKRPFSIEDPKTNAYLSTRKPAVLHVKLLNAPATQANIKYTLVTFGSAFQRKAQTHFDKNNEATIVLTQNLPYQQIWLQVDKYLYAGVYVNEGLSVTIDASKLKNKEVFMIAEGIEYSGADGMLNKVMNERVLFRKKESDNLNSILVDIAIKKANYNIKIKDNDSLNAQYKMVADSIYQKLNEIDEAFLEKYPKYDWAIKNETLSGFYQWLITGFSGIEILEKYLTEIKTHQPYFTSNSGVGFYRSLMSYYAFKKNVDEPSMTDALYKNYNSYNTEGQQILDSIKYYETEYKSEAKPPALVSAAYKKMREHFDEEITQINFDNHISRIDKHNTPNRADILKMILLEYGKDNFAIVYPQVLNTVKTGWCRKIIQEELTEATAKQKEIDQLFQSAKTITSDSFYIGKPLMQLPFGANLYSSEGIKSIDDFLVNLKNKFKGKALILDLWATWCAPCISDIPNSKKLHEENKDLPIEYIYLCTDAGSDEKTWRNRVGALKASGTHIFLKDELMTKLRHKLNAEGGYPTYVVIDINGKVKLGAISRMGGLNRESLIKATGIKK